MILAGNRVSGRYKYVREEKAGGANVYPERFLASFVAQQIVGESNVTPKVRCFG